MSAEPAISVVIPTLGRRPEVLARALACLDARTGGPASLEVVLVADAACAQGAEPAAGFPRLALRHLQAERAGASAARNAGWRAARAPLVLFLDDDILADPVAVAEHLAAHRDEPDPRTAVLGHVRWADELRSTALMRWLDDGIQFDYRWLRDGEDAGWGRFYTANLSIKRQLLERVGGFDEERFPFGYEDLDLALRLSRETGLRLRYRRAASAQHLHLPELAEWRTRVERIASSERRFVERHPDVEPYFLRRFSAAAAQPAPRGRGARLAAIAPPWVPWLGPRAQASAAAVFERDLAPRFLAAWERAGVTGAI
jgi:GT2 family glycosyltransferase